MRQILKITATLWLSLMAIMSGFLILRAQPVDWTKDFGELDNCGDQFCFAGIVVGQTRIEEAKAILVPHTADTKSESHLASPTINALIGNMQISIVQFQNKGATVNVSISYKPPLTLDKLILRFGKPCFIKLVATNSMAPGLGIKNTYFLFQLYYPSVIANVVIPPAHDHTRIEFNRPVELTLTRKMLDCDRKALQWQGFTTLEHYIHTVN